MNRFKIVCKAKKENNLFQRCRPCEHQHFIIIDKFFFSVQNSDVGSKKDTKGFFIPNQIILMIASYRHQRKFKGRRERAKKRRTATVLKKSWCEESEDRRFS